MSGADEVSKPRSLGEMLDALVSGGQCPWCGAELDECAASELSQVDGDVQPVPCSEGVVLCCVECGAEVHAKLRGARPSGARVLGAAA